MLLCLSRQLSVTIDDDTSSMGHSEERKEIANMVRQKMKKMEILLKNMVWLHSLLLVSFCGVKVVLIKMLKRMKALIRQRCYRESTYCESMAQKGISSLGRQNLVSQKC